MGTGEVFLQIAPAFNNFFLNHFGFLRKSSARFLLDWFGGWIDVELVHITSESMPSMSQGYQVKTLMLSFKNWTNYAFSYGLRELHTRNYFFSLPSSINTFLRSSWTLSFGGSGENGGELLTQWLSGGQLQGVLAMLYSDTTTCQALVVFHRALYQARPQAKNLVLILVEPQNKYFYTPSIYIVCSNLIKLVYIYIYICGSYLHFYFRQGTQAGNA